jgi:HAMP domain-containing protein
MYNAGGLDQFENITIPEGDPGEQLVAYLLLSPIVCQLYALPNAIVYISQAHELAVRLAGQSITYRPETPSKFARLDFELQGTTEIVLLSLINNVLVMPPVGPSELSKLLLTEDIAINLTNLSVAHFMLRFRTRRLAAALDPLRTVKSAVELVDSTRRILAKCFYREIISEGPLDRADDCFMLARALIRTISNWRRSL